MIVRRLCAVLSWTMSTESRLDILQKIADTLEPITPVEIGTMFRSPGIRADGKIVAFLGRDDRLIIKLPAKRARELRDGGVVDDVVMGARTMREWVSISAREDDEATFAAWLPLAREALSYVETL